MSTVFIKSVFGATLQDLGRSGATVLGFPPNGALDQFSLRAANVLVGNRTSDVAIEITVGHLSFSTDFPVLIAVTGADAEISVDGKIQDMWRPLYAYPGEQINVSVANAGLRSYVSFSGRFTPEVFMGSCSPDRVAGFAPSLQPGDEVDIQPKFSAERSDTMRRPNFALIGAPKWKSIEDPIPFLEGPESRHFAAANSTLAGSDYEMSQHTDQVGSRLSGRTPQQVSPTSSTSRAMPLGAMEIPSDGELMVLNRGRGVTAGYPVLGIVTTTGLDALSQCVPGANVRFTQVSYQQALDQLMRQRAWLYDATIKVQRQLAEHFRTAELCKE